MPTEKNKTNNFDLNDDLTYIYLYRRLIKSPVFHNEGLLKVWIWCLLKASYKNNVSVPIVTGKGLSEVIINKGQFVFGRQKAAQALNMRPKTVYNRVLKLKRLEQLDIQSNSHYSIITITNWELYQVSIPAEWQTKGQPHGQAKDRQRTGKGQAKDTNNNGNKDNKYIKGKKRKIKTDAPDFEKFMAEIDNKTFQDWFKKKNVDTNKMPLTNIVESFLSYHESKGNKFVNWKSALHNWINKGVNEYKSIPAIEESKSFFTYPLLTNKVGYDPRGNDKGELKYWRLEPVRNKEFRRGELFDLYRPCKAYEEGETEPDMTKEWFLPYLEHPEWYLPWKEALKKRKELQLNDIDPKTGKEIDEEGNIIKYE